MQRVWGVLGLLLAACGQTAKNAPDHGAGDGGASTAGEPASGESSAGEPAGGSASSGPPSCLYPIQGLNLPPGSTDQPRLSFQLSQPMPLTGLAGTWSDLAATYDVNGDAVSDFLYLDAEAEPARFRLATTGTMVEPFHTYDRDCEALQQLPAGRLLLRDLNGDQVPDFVIGTERGVHAFLNQPEGTKAVLAFDTTDDRAALINVGTADLNGDGRTDLVASLDGVLQVSSSDFEVNVIAFVQAEDGSFSELSRRTSTFVGGQQAEPFFFGYLAAGRFGAASSAVLLGSRDQASRRFGMQTRFDAQDDRWLSLPDGIDDRIYGVLTLPSTIGNDRLLAVGQDTAYLLDLSEDSPKLVTQKPLAFTHSPTHEFGGGPERPSIFAYDIDRDGDLDFLQTNPERSSLALMLNFGNAELDEPQLFAVSARSGAETPFIQLGPGSAIVGDAISENPPAVYSLIREIKE